MVSNTVVDRAPPAFDASTGRTADVVESVHVAGRWRGWWGSQRQQPTDGVGELLGFGERKSSAPGAPRALAVPAPAAGSVAGGLLGLVLGLQLIPPGVVPLGAGLLLESGDGFGGKALESRAPLVEVLVDPAALQDADGAVTRGTYRQRRQRPRSAAASAAVGQKRRMR